MIITLLSVFGLCFGSFVNALTWRMHEQAKPKKKRAASDRDLSMVKGRSMCPHCKHALAPVDLLPVLSWVLLGGKCRYCHKPIPDNPLVEVALPIISLVSYLYWPFNFGSEGKTLFVFWLIFLVGFMAMFVYDLRWYLLPNKIVYPLLGLVAIRTLVVIVFYQGGMHAVTEAAYGLLFGGGIFYAIFQVSKGRWIGGGDVKLGAVLGIVVGGPWMALLMLFIASCLGSLVSVPLLLSGRAKKDTRLPFGPFLILGTIIVYLFGASMIAWYKRQVMLA